jgi:hypothetical protein
VTFWKRKNSYDYRFSVITTYFCLPGADFGNVKFNGHIYAKNPDHAKEILESWFGGNAQYYSEVP